MPIKKLTVFPVKLVDNVDLALARLEAYPHDILGSHELAVVSGWTDNFVWSRTYRKREMPKGIRLTSGTVYYRASIKAWIEKQRGGVPHRSTYKKGSSDANQETK